MASLTFVCSRADGRSMIVYLAPEPGMLDQWHLLALESVDGGRGMQAVLDDHAHSDQGTVGTLKKAIEAAEAFARKWQRGKVGIEECPCDELPAAGE